MLESPNILCTKVAKCALRSERYDNQTRKEYEVYIRRWSSRHRVMIPPELDSFQMSMSHEICHLPSDIIEKQLQCAFQSKDIPREFIVVRFRLLHLFNSLYIDRNPLKRALSVYYFWGELWKMRGRAESSKVKQGKRRPIRADHRRLNGVTLWDAQHGNTFSHQEESRVQLGDTYAGKNITPIRGSLFTYHGDESTVPSEDIAMAYATRVPLTPGMPGPSLTWSCYARTVDDAMKGFDAPFQGRKRSGPKYRISPVVTERLDESLVVLSDHLSWSIADMVNVVPRKVH